MIDGVPLIGFRFYNGNLLLTLRLYNELNHLVLLAQDGLLSYDPRLWDITFTGRVLRVRSAQRRTRIKIRFEPPSTIRVLEGLFLLNGIGLRVNRHGLMCLNSGDQMAFEDLSAVTQPGDRVQAAFAMGRIPTDVPIGASLSGINRYRGLDLSKRASPIQPRSEGM